MRVLLKSAKLVAVLLSLGWAAFAIYLGSISNSGHIIITEVYAHINSNVSTSGTVFLLVENGTDLDDRLIAAKTDAALNAMLHTHIETNTGVMQMRHVEGGFSVLAGEKLVLARGGKHVMLMGLTRPLVQGDEITLILTFEQAGEMRITVPVNLGR